VSAVLWWAAHLAAAALALVVLAGVTAWAVLS
jgi:hypothetical protein